MRRNQKYRIQKSVTEITRTIEKYSDDELTYLGNPLSYFQDYNKSLNGSNPFFKSTTTNNVFKLRSKTLKYWPISVIILKELDDSETLVTIRYKLFGLYLSMLILFFVGFIALITLAIVDENSDPRGAGLAALVVLISNLILTYLFGWLQKNVVRLLER